MFHWTRTTGLESPQDSIFPEIETALVPINSTAWKTAQHFSYGARGFMRVPVSEANDLNYLLNKIFNDCELLMRRLATEALGHMLLGWRSESTFLISQMECGVIFYQELNIPSTKMQSRTVLTRQYLRWG
jgi:hypothetical protein